MDAQRGTKRKSYDMMNAFVTAAQASVVSSSTPSPSSQEQPSRRRRRCTSSSESKKRNMDSFLEELKNKHDRGEEETNSYLSLSSTCGVRARSARISIISHFHESINRAFSLFLGYAIDRHDDENSAIPTLEHRYGSRTLQRTGHDTTNFNRYRVVVCSGNVDTQTVASSSASCCGVVLLIIIII